MQEFTGWARYEGISWVRDEEGRHIHISQALKPTTWGNVPTRDGLKAWDFYFDKLAHDRPADVKVRVLEYLDELGFDEPCSVKAKREVVAVTASKKVVPTMRVRVKMYGPVQNISMF
jgi:hypothetical protein